MPRARQSQKHSTAIRRVVRGPAEFPRCIPIVAQIAPDENELRHQCELCGENALMHRGLAMLHGTNQAAIYRSPKINAQRPEFVKVSLRPACRKLKDSVTFEDVGERCMPTGLATMLMRVFP